MSRTISVHLSVEVVDGDTRDPDEIAEEILGHLAPDGWATLEAIRGRAPLVFTGGNVGALGGEITARVSVALIEEVSA